MVLKLSASDPSCLVVFENDVEMYGAQTLFHIFRIITKFENDVEMYGAQTHKNT